MAGSKRKFRLKFLFQEFDLTAGGFTIGRSPSCNLTLEDPLVSRRHASITTHDTHAVIDDLGSRNGTLVNGEPVFDAHRLTHSDKIRIGTHELIFVEEKRYSARKVTLGDATVICPGCGMPFSRDEAQCPSCGNLLIPDNVCTHCRVPASAEALYCSKCGNPLRRDDSTIPVELGGDAAGWTSQLIDEVIEKALSVKRFEQAARLLDGKIREFDKEWNEGTADRDALIALAEFNLAIAQGLRDSKRLLWVIDRFRRFQEQMPESLLEQLEKAAAGWYDIGPDLESYAKAIETGAQGGAGYIARLKEMISKPR